MNKSDPKSNKIIFKQKQVIMLLSNGFSPDPRVLQEARSLVKHGYKVTIYAWDRENRFKKNEVFEGIFIHRIKIKSIYGRGNSQVFTFLAVYMVFFFRLLFKHYDLFHCHDFDMLPIGFLLTKLKRSKIIYDSHECYVDMLINVNPKIKSLLTKFEDYLLSRVDIVITVGELLGEYFKARGARNVEIIGNWKSPHEFNVPQGILQEKRSQLGLNGQFIVTYIGFLNKDRKIIELIHSIEKRHDNCVALIGGLGAMTNEVKAEISKSKHSIWLGYVNPEQIPLFTCLSDAIYYGLNPEIPISTYSAPNKLFEALAAGKPLLALKVGEIGKIVAEDKCGVTIESYDADEINNAIDYLRQNYETLAVNAKTLGVEKYSWEIAEKRLLNIYNIIFQND